MPPLSTSTMLYPNRAVSLLVAVFASKSNPVVANAATNDDADSGILFPDPAMGREDRRYPGNSRALAPSQQCAAAGYVDCVNGFLRNDSSISCAAACQGNCCSGAKSCHGFTGKICKDGSCQGILACVNANIPFVMNSCKLSNACSNAGRDGTVESIVNSCSGTMACYQLGYNEGVVGYVQDSCNGYFACDSGGSGDGGSVGNIVTSCNAYKACYHAGKGPTGGISSNMLNDCCNACSECTYSSQHSLPAQCQVRLYKAHTKLFP